MKVLVEKLIDQQESNSKFVGLKKGKDNYILMTPYGYDFDLDEISLDNRSDIYKVRRLLKAISKALKSSNVKENLTEELSEGSSILSGINVIKDYFEYGIYNEYRKDYKVGMSGKINFKKTITKQVPLVSEDGFFYKDFIVECNTVNEDTLIRQSQISIINHFMKNGGKLIFGANIRIPGNELKIDRTLRNRLIKLRNESFSSRKIQLVNYMIKYIEYCDFNADKGTLEMQYTIIASTLWQEMLNSCYSNQIELDTTKYGNQYIRYNFRDKNSYRGSKTKHDTIYEDDNKILIIDAKHYKNEFKLVSEDVVAKQFGYFYSASIHQPNKNIYNIFIIPKLNNKNKGFREYVIHRPQIKSLNEFIFVYCVEYEEILNNYINDKKLTSKLINELKEFINQDNVKKYLKDLNNEFGFKSNDNYFEI